MLVRVQKDFPATSEILAPYAVGPYVAGGGMRGISPDALDAGPASVWHQLLRWSSGDHLCRIRHARDSSPNRWTRLPIHS